MAVIAFRIPGGKLERYEAVEERDIKWDGNQKPYFVVAGFDPEEKTRFYGLSRKLDSISDSDLHLVEPDWVKNMTRDEHREYVEAVCSWTEGRQDKKAVAARVAVESFGRIGKERREGKEVDMLEGNIESLVRRLCVEYPDAFVFLISTEQDGTWIGASPELLLERDGDQLQTVALAGTRPADTQGEWDEKNVKEQAIVADYIWDVFREVGLNPERGGTSTRRAGGVEHIVTPISARIEGEINFGNLLKRLSPTPALAGFPKEEAIKIILDREGTRKLYGGFCGPVFAGGDFRINVILRCACMGAGCCALFAGGGITALSDPDEEWNETERKLATMRNVMRFFAKK